VCHALAAYAIPASADTISPQITNAFELAISSIKVYKHHAILTAKLALIAVSAHASHAIATEVTHPLWL
jgi:hypothetical protein